MGIAGIAGRILCSNPVSFVLGVGIGIVGMYVISRAEEQKRLVHSQKELEEAIQMLEAQQSLLVAEQERGSINPK